MAEELDIKQLQEDVAIAGAYIECYSTNGYVTMETKSALGLLNTIRQLSVMLEEKQ